MLWRRVLSPPPGAVHHDTQVGSLDQEIATVLSRRQPPLEHELPYPAGIHPENRGGYSVHRSASVGLRSHPRLANDLRTCAVTITEGPRSSGTTYHVGTKRPAVPKNGDRRPGTRYSV